MNHCVRNWIHTLLWDLKDIDKPQKRCQKMWTMECLLSGMVADKSIGVIV